MKTWLRRKTIKVCNEVVDRVRNACPADHLILAFVDLTGLQIHFDTIRRLVEDRKVDLLMTIQFGMGIRMNLQQYIQSEGDALTAFLRNDAWRKDVKVGGSYSQFGHRILDRYLDQLKTLGYGTVQ